MTGPSIVFGQPSYDIDDVISLEVLPGDVHPMTVEVSFSASITYANGAILAVNAPATISGKVQDVEGFGYDVEPDPAQPEGFHYLATPTA